MMNMMYGFGGWWLLGLGMMVLFWIAIMLLVIWVVRSLFPRQKGSGSDQALETLRQRFAAGELNAAEYEQARSSMPVPPPSSGVQSGPTALEILRQRYARGEIDTATFEQMRERLEATPGYRPDNQAMTSGR